ncbi:hypothetical protein ASPCADRAFT_209751, partial [Aspergillus carbonarius ITEM 5010]
MAGSAPSLVSLLANSPPPAPSIRGSGSPSQRLPPGHTAYLDPLPLLPRTRAGAPQSQSL